MLGVCESIAPDIFEINDDGDMVILQGEPGEARRHEVENAVASCPTAALRLVG
jgi:ferredoxin